MSKKFWNVLIKQAFEEGNLAEDLRKASWQFKHDIFFGKSNITWGLVYAYDNNTSYTYDSGDLTTFQTAADKFLKVARPHFKSQKTKYPNLTKKYSDGFIVTILPRKGQQQKGVHGQAQTYVDPIHSEPYNTAMNLGWEAAHKEISKKLTKEKARKPGMNLAFLHADDPSAAKKGAGGKGTDRKGRDYGVYGKNKKWQKSKIGGRKTTIGTYGASVFQSSMKARKDRYQGATASYEYDLERKLSDPDTLERDRPKIEEELKLIKFAKSIPAKTLDMFTERAQSSVLKYLKTDLGWKMTRSKTAKGRKIEFIFDGSVGSSAEQPKQNPWDLPIPKGEFKRSGIAGRLNEVLEASLTELLKDLAGHKPEDIRASETIGEIMESDLAGTTLDTIRKHFRSKKNVKVKVIRKTKKVKDNKSTQDRLNIRTKVGGKGKIRQGRTHKRKTGKGKAPIAKSTGRPDLRYKAARLPQHSPIALTQLLNKALPDELKKNMTGVYPRSLEWRTGRFAQSAEVRSIVPFPNLTQIQYTYMKDPYEVFEGKGGRDPRQIIGETIRQLAQSIMGTRFGLVRTKRI